VVMVAVCAPTAPARPIVNTNSNLFIAGQSHHATGLRPLKRLMSTMMIASTSKM
jgi:hypothetical protein